MSPPPLFSIVIPCYNYAHVLPRAINSVLQQSGEDWELIVVNDGSKDNTSEVMADFLSKQSRAINYIEQDNAGAAASRNGGFKASNGQYLVFLDADDEMSSGAMDHYREAVKSEPRTGFFIGGHESVFVSGKIKPSLPAKISSDPFERLKAYLLDKKLHAVNGAVLMRRDIFNNYLYPISLRNVEDISMFAYVLANYDVAPINHVLARIHRHEDSLRHNTDYAKKIGLSMIDEVFSQDRLPGAFQKLRKPYTSQRALSLFRTFYLAGEFQLARSYYHKAVTISPSALLKMSYLKKYLKSIFK